MAFPGAERLLDFSQEFDVGMLDTVVGAFYTPGGDPVTVRPNPRARPDRFTGITYTMLRYITRLYSIPLTLKSATVTKQTPDSSETPDRHHRAARARAPRGASARGRGQRQVEVLRAASRRTWAARTARVLKPIAV